MKKSILFTRDNSICTFTELGTGIEFPIKMNSNQTMDEIVTNTDGLLKRSKTYDAPTTTKNINNFKKQQICENSIDSKFPKPIIIKLSKSKSEHKISIKKKKLNLKYKPNLKMKML